MPRQLLGEEVVELAGRDGLAEDLVGEFKRRLAAERPGETFEALTKWVPQPGFVSESAVSRAIERSLRRMDVEALDLLQFHWWEYRDLNYLTALKYLAKLQEQGLIRHLALTNFDTERLRIITDYGIRVVSNQVQYSLIDRRPAQKMAAYCEKNGIGLLEEPGERERASRRQQDDDGFAEVQYRLRQVTLAAGQSEAHATRRDRGR